MWIWLSHVPSIGKSRAPCQQVPEGRQNLMAPETHDVLRLKSSDRPVVTVAFKLPSCHGKTQIWGFSTLTSQEWKGQIIEISPENGSWKMTRATCANWQLFAFRLRLGWVLRNFFLVQNDLSGALSTSRDGCLPLKSRKNVGKSM